MIGKIGNLQEMKISFDIFAKEKSSPNQRENLLSKEQPAYIHPFHISFLSIYQFCFRSFSVFLLSRSLNSRWRLGYNEERRMHRRERQKETAARGLNGGRETRRVEVKRTSVPTGAVTRGRGWAERRTGGHETGGPHRRDSWETAS